uniref:Uncharacterized protein n=1 Tax=Cacopsylla melanoneura TaxID=428564 RepID=A0A8D9EEV9_9HEMI
MSTEMELETIRAKAAEIRTDIHTEEILLEIIICTKKIDFFKEKLYPELETVHMKGIEPKTDIHMKGKGMKHLEIFILEILTGTTGIKPETDVRPKEKELKTGIHMGGIDLIDVDPILTKIKLDVLLIKEI